MLTIFLFCLCAYLIGSLSTAVLISKAFHLPDPRTQGSRNPGATNVLRLGNKKAAAFTLVGDTLKGLIPVVIARSLDWEASAIAAVGVSAFLGHLYPIFLGFRGGKGVATALGVLLGMSAMLGGLAAITWLVIAKVFRISSLAALLAAALAPLYAWILQLTPSTIIAASVMSLFILWRHRLNIQRLAQGAEGKIGGN